MAKPQAEKPKDNETKSQDIKQDKKERPTPLRRSKRILRTQENSKKNKPDQTSSSAEKKHSPPHPQPSNSQKQPREGEHLANRTPSERPRKRVRPSHWHTLDQEAVVGLSESRCSHISHWAQEEHVWPGDFFQREDVSENQTHRAPVDKRRLAALLNRKSESSLITESYNMTTGGPRTSGKGAIYSNARYEAQLKQLGVFMEANQRNVTDKSIRLYQELLETPQTLPQDSLFDKDEIFKATCAKVLGRNECRIIRDIALLIVPSAENLAIRGAEHLQILTETVNEGWNDTIPLLGPRPQPDYSVGFHRDSFNEDQLRKLQPLIGDIHGRSRFVATYNMFLPFLAAEVKSSKAGDLTVAERQNAHSMTIGLIGLVDLFRSLGREDELHGEINCFSVSHDARVVNIYGHYAMMNGTKTTYHRCLIREFCFTELQNRWAAYTFVKNVYDIWVPTHFKRICAAIDDLPDEEESDLDFTSHPHVSSTSVLSQPIESDGNKKRKKMRKA